MDLDPLKQFVHLARTLNYGKASRLSHVSPSTLSRSIQRLEAICGKALFDRDRRHVALTPAGQQYLKFAEETLNHWSQLHANLEQSEGILKGSLTLFCSVTASYSVLPPLLNTFRKLYPQVNIKLLTGDANKAIDHLLNGDAEIAIAPLPDKLPQALIGQEVIQMPLHLIVPIDAENITPLFQKKPIPWHDIPLILPESGLIRTYIQQWFAQKGVTPNIYGEVAGHEAILSLVSLGLGVGVVPKLVLEASLIQTKVKIVEVSPSFPDFKVGLCLRKSQLANAVPKAFWKAMEDYQSSNHFYSTS